MKTVKLGISVLSCGNQTTTRLMAVWREKERSEQRGLPMHGPSNAGNNGKVERSWCWVMMASGHLCLGWTASYRPTRYLVVPKISLYVTDILLSIIHNFVQVVYRRLCYETMRKLWKGWWFCAVAWVFVVSESASYPSPHRPSPQNVKYIS